MKSEYSRMGGAVFFLLNKIALENILREILMQIGKKHRFFKRNILISFHVKTV
jgi:hypothetical protein